MEPIIKLNNVSVVYGAGQDNEMTALKDINLEIFPGEYVVFFGPSGCGKSTLLYTIAGLEFPTAGGVIVNGSDLASLSPGERIEYYRTTIGMVFQAFYLVPHLTAKDNLILPHIFRGTPPLAREEKAKEIMDKFGVSAFAHRKPSMMSGGQQQRTAIGRALMGDPSIILADEPVGNLDSKNAEIVLEMLSQIHRKEKKTVIQVTHNAADLHYADRVFYMKDGRVERVVENKPAEKGGSKNELDRLAALYPHDSNERLRARIIVSHLLMPYESYVIEKIEMAVEKMLKKEINHSGLYQFLDSPTGAALNSEKAKHLAVQIQEIVLEMEKLKEKEYPSLKHKEAAASELRRFVLERYSNQMTTRQIDRIDSLLSQRLCGDIEVEELVKALDLPESSGGVGLNRQTAYRLADEIELMVTKK